MAKRKYVVFNNDVAPVHPGVYQREMSHAGRQKWFWAKYADGGWYQSFSKYEAAKNCKHELDISYYQKGDKSPYSTLRWRGLAEKPE